MIPTFIMDHRKLIQDENSGDLRGEYSQWQQWARQSRRRHVDPRMIQQSPHGHPRMTQSSHDLLSEDVDLQAEHHMRYPTEPSFVVPAQRKPAPVHVTEKTIPVSPRLYSYHDHNAYNNHNHEVDVGSRYRSHQRNSSFTSMSLDAAAFTEQEEEEHYQEQSELHSSQQPLQYSEFSSQPKHDSHDHMSVARKTTSTANGNGLYRGLATTMPTDNSSLNNSPMLRATSSIIRQQEAIMRDIDERREAEQREEDAATARRAIAIMRDIDERRVAEQREQGQRGAATARRAIALDAGSLTQKTKSSSSRALPVQDPFARSVTQKAKSSSSRALPVQDRQQEAIMRDIDERREAEQRDAATARRAIAIDAGSLTQKTKSSSSRALPVQDPFARSLTQKTKSSSSRAFPVQGPFAKLDSKQAAVAAKTNSKVTSSGCNTSVWNWSDSVHGSRVRVRILDQTRVQQAISQDTAVTIKCISCQQTLVVVIDRPLIYCPQCSALVPTDLLVAHHQTTDPDPGRRFS
jgi:hypothetical protein